MKTEKPDLAEEAAKWLQRSGFEQDLADLVAGLHDIGDAMRKINEQLLPTLITLKPDQKREALQIVVDWWLEMEHIERHAGAASTLLAMIRDVLDES